MLGPKSHPLDRLMAIYHSITNGDNNSNPNVFSQVETEEGEKGREKERERGGERERGREREGEREGERERDREYVYGRGREAREMGEGCSVQ